MSQNKLISLFHITPFGSAINTRSYSSGAYRYGFNGKETDEESFSGAIAFEARILDSRIGRFLSLDPLQNYFSSSSNYSFAKNRTIDGVDFLGLYWKPVKSDGTDSKVGEKDIDHYVYVPPIIKYEYLGVKYDDISKLPNGYDQKLLKTINTQPENTVESITIETLSNDGNTKTLVEYKKDAKEKKETKYYKAKNMKTSDKGVSAICDYEGFESKWYDLGDGMYTIGYGHAEPKSKGKPKTYPNGITKDEAKDLMKKDLSSYEKGVQDAFGDAWLSQNQFDALVSVCYNRGVSGFKNSNMKSSFDKAKDATSVENVFLKAHGLSNTSKFYKGIQNRRNKEAKMFNKDTYL